MRCVLTIAMVMGVTASAGAQNAGRPDSATIAGYRTQLLDVRRAVDLVSARSNDLRRDLAMAGEATLVARAKRLVETCGAARATLGSARSVFAGARLASAYRGVRDSLVQEMRSLSSTLSRECQEGLAPEGPGARADSLRAWTPYRTSQITQAISLYYGAAGTFARRLGFDLARP